MAYIVMACIVMACIVTCPGRRDRLLQCLAAALRRLAGERTDRARLRMAGPRIGSHDDDDDGDDDDDANQDDEDDDDGDR